MTSRLNRAFAATVALALTLSGCGGGGDAEPGPAPGPAAPGTQTPAPPAPAPGGPAPAPAAQVVTLTLKSDQVGFTYPIQIYLPPSYAAGTATYPVIYATEGDAPFGTLPDGPRRARFTDFKEAMQARDTQAILVGIGGWDRRGTDFLLPGAASYLAFITRELVPLIERQYRADPKRRALSGLSHGGYFVVAALVLEAAAGAPGFSHYLSTESSFGAEPNLAAYLAFEKRLDPGGPKPLPVTLFLAGASGSNMPIVNALHDQLAAHAHPGLTLQRAEYNTTHVGADLPAFEEALRRYFTP